MKKLFYSIYLRVKSKFLFFRAEVVVPYNSFPRQFRKASWLEYVYNYILYGCSADEFNCLSFFNRNARSKREFVTIRKNRKLDKLFNTIEANKILWDKRLFNEHFSCFNKRNYLEVNPDVSDLQLENFASAHPTGYLVKPNFLFYGRGIYKANGVEELKKLRESGGSYLVEEIITNCKELSLLNESSLNTLRCVTCIDSKGKVHIIAIILRTGGKGAVVDNVHSGGTFYHVDVDEGIVDAKGMDAYGNSNYLRHPSNGCVMLGYTIPRFKEMKEFVVKVAQHLPDARYVGWDIAITLDGFEVIEGNVSPGAGSLQCDQKGLLRTINSFY